MGLTMLPCTHLYIKQALKFEESLDVCKPNEFQNQKCAINWRCHFYWIFFSNINHAVQMFRAKPVLTSHPCGIQWNKPKPEQH